MPAHSSTFAVKHSQSPPKRMASGRTKALRAVAAVPFLLLAVWYLQTMDLEKVVAQQKPFVGLGLIEGAD
jgi:hypothetical protein